jgi:Transposase, Mutator family
VKRAKGYPYIPTRYYRPDYTTCPHCGHALRRSHQRWQKHVVFLHGQEWVVNLAYRCLNATCREAQCGRVHTAPAADRLTLRGSSFALEVIVQIGYWRFWQRWTIARIHEVLTKERHLPISEREVLYVVGVFLVLLRCTYPRRLAEHAAYFRRHGMFVAVDALRPEKGNRALYVVREVHSGLVLHVVSVQTATQPILAKQVLRPVNALGYRIRGVISDEEVALCRAIAQVWPGAAHQTCHWHCLRDAAAPLLVADRALKKAVKQALRDPMSAVTHALERLSPEDPCTEVLVTYSELIRTSLLESSKPPFVFGSLRTFAALGRLEASLQRSQQKGGIRC